MTALQTHVIDGHTVVISWQPSIAGYAGGWHWRLHAPNHAWLASGTALDPDTALADAVAAIHQGAAA